MKKLLTSVVLIMIVFSMAVMLSACKDETAVEEIDHYEIDELILTEGDTLSWSSVVVTCYLKDETTKTVSNNLTYQESVVKDILDDDKKIITGAGGKSYDIKVYHLEEEIGTLKLTVKVKK